MDSTPDGARKKVERALASLVKNLGGWRPYHDKDTTKTEETNHE
jgi:hypothetical protein